MNLLAGDLTPTEGEQRRSHKLRVGRYAQHFVDALRMDETPVDYLLSRYPESGAGVAVGLSVRGHGGVARVAGGGLLAGWMSNGAAERLTQTCAVAVAAGRWGGTGGAL
jgi:hypothetical protein